MTIVIIEDEYLAAKRLHDLIKRYDPKAEIIENLVSVKKSVEWFQNNPQPHLILCDIQLADGLSFEIFEQVQINSPVIFTTAYDEYALRAFKLNSIDYLLKPIDFDELVSALSKYERIYQKENTIQTLAPLNLEELVKMLGPQYKNRFVVKIGDHLRPVEVNEIQYFYSLEKSTFLYTFQKNNYCLDYSLDQLEKLTNPKQFFRINRKYLVNISSIHQVISYSNSRLKIQFKNSESDDAVVSREKVQLFKNWLE